MENFTTVPVDCMVWNNMYITVKRYSILSLRSYFQFPLGVSGGCQKQYLNPRELIYCFTDPPVYFFIKNCPKISCEKNSNKFAFSLLWPVSPFMFIYIPQNESTLHDISIKCL